MNKAPETLELNCSKEFLNHSLEYLEAYCSILLGARLDKHYVAMPKYSTRREIGKLMNWDMRQDDRGLLTVLLKPGELTKPIPLERPGQPWHLNIKGVPSEGDKASIVGEQIVDALYQVYVCHYKPHSWLPAIRLEFAESVAKNMHRLATVIQGLKHQCATASMLEPYPIYLADRTVKALSSSLPTFRQVATQYISENYDGISERFSLLCMATEARRGIKLTDENDVEQIIGQTERIGVIGSPSSTSQLALDILGVAAGRKLVGELALFGFPQDGLAHYAIGQITEVELRNIWHEDPTMRSLIRQRGRVDAVSERQDTHLGKMIVSAVFQKIRDGVYEPSILGTVPCTGTPIYVVTDEVLDEILQPYKSQVFYLGHVYGSKPKLPLWFKHFDKGPDGAGEAYHIGIFGKTGSGKSVLAKMVLLAYARYPKMALLLIDPQGEFAKDVRGQSTGEFRLPLGKILEKQGKQTIVLTVRNLVLDTWELFEQILFESPFFERLSIPKGENREIACNILAEKLERAR